MPYKITKKGGKSCVTKSDSGEVIQGGCHKSRDEAVSHLQALYANEAMAAIANSFGEDDDEVEETIDLAGEVETEEDFEVYTIGENESLWAGYVAFEEEATGDNRSFSENAITWNDLPLPLLWQKTSSDGHSGSVVIGRVDEMERRGKAIFARGVILDTEEGREYKSLLEAGAAGGVSVDGDSAQYSVEEVEGGKHKVNFNAIRIRGVTCVAIPAFANAKLSLITEENADAAEFCVGGCPPEGCDHSLSEYKSKKRKLRKGSALSMVAAGAPVRPPIQWFQDQNLPGPTPLTVLEDGQVYGHLALWGTCHIGMPACTTPPKGGTYGYFHTGAIDTEEGVEVSVGHLTFNTGHASIHDNAYNAASHYDHTGAVAADVTAGEDEFGIWVAGALRPHLTEEEVRTFKSAPLSGDWRRIGARLELVGALSVNTPGFPVPRQKAKVLVASGGEDQTFISTLEESDYEAIGRSIYKDDLAARVEEFYNQCHGEGGRFCEGPDGPGRLRDNMKRAEKTLGKKAPAWMKNMLSRKTGAAIKQGEKLLPKNAPQYMKDMMKRKMEEKVTGQKTMEYRPERDGKAEPKRMPQIGKSTSKATPLSKREAAEKEIDSMSEKEVNKIYENFYADKGRYPKNELEAIKHRDAINKEADDFDREVREEAEFEAEEEKRHEEYFKKKGQSRWIDLGKKGK